MIEYLGCFDLGILILLLLRLLRTENRIQNPAFVAVVDGYAWLRRRRGFSQSRRDVLGSSPETTWPGGALLATVLPHRSIWVQRRHRLGSSTVKLFEQWEVGVERREEPELAAMAAGLIVLLRV